MREIHWELMGSALPQVIVSIILLSAAYTLIGAFVMKFFVRKVPLFSHAYIFFWAVLRVMLIFIVFAFIGTIFNISVGPLSGVLGLIGMCAVGWLITHDLAKYYGTPTKFPAAGAKGMFGTLLVIWVIVGVVYLLSLAGLVAL